MAAIRNFILEFENLTDNHRNNSIIYDYETPYIDDQPLSNNFDRTIGDNVDREITGFETDPGKYISVKNNKTNENNKIFGFYTDYSNTNTLLGTPITTYMRFYFPNRNALVFNNNKTKLV